MDTKRDDRRRPQGGRFTDPHRFDEVQNLPEVEVGEEAYLEDLDVYTVTEDDIIDEDDLLEGEEVLDVEDPHTSRAAKEAFVDRLSEWMGHIIDEMERTDPAERRYLYLQEKLRRFTQEMERVLEQLSEEEGYEKSDVEDVWRNPFRIDKAKDAKMGFQRYFKIREPNRGTYWISEGGANEEAARDKILRHYGNVEIVDMSETEPEGYNRFVEKGRL